ncbi:hypothetical protein PPL_04588 [Heterostelium album PN500]|uniref:Uncharacterized protein n=1 Tax=Heterostelium pallidum (strain ATCC 26659 / Pp 5 / PN500) TaxID=670386 RepID=D3B800_HETP5|nr:hypothetical protein PPL_04588 [Heterostelium album PN500]EFA82168.1 hypothetical protein PPL_04588 [Heterostelium album PN500]|eukprot:XP_020434285.1 hypothetical protein PPL_04588 [Heterostelium album PN500]
MILVNSDDYNKDEDKGGDSVVVGEIVLESSDITSTATATITTSLLSLSNHLLVYIFQYVLEPLEFKCCNQSAAGFKTRVLGNYCYIDSYHNVNNILIRYGTICKRFCNAIVPKLTRHLQLFIQDGLDLWRMVKLSRYGLLKDNNHNGNNGGGVQFGHIEISRYSRVSQHGLMAAMGVDLPVITDCASLRSVQSLTIESLLSTPSFLISLMSNTSLTRLSLSTGQFAIADYQNLVTMISRISTSLSSLKLFNPLFLNNGNNINNNIQSISLTSTSTTSNSNNINSNIDFIELLTKHYEDSTKTTSPPHSYGNLLNLSLTGYSRDSLLNDNRSIHTLKCTQLDGTNQDILEILHSQSKLPTKTLESLTLSIVISCSKLMKYLIDLMFNHTSSDSGSNSNNSDYISNLSLKIDPYCQDESLLQLLSYLKIVNNNSNNSNNVQLEQKQQQQQHRKTQLETLTIERISSLKQPKCYHMIHSLLAQQNNNVLLNLNHHQQQQILLQQDHIDILIPQHSQQQQEEFIHIYLQKNLKSDWELSRLG